jgi:hypothetical protein
MLLRDHPTDAARIKAIRAATAVARRAIFKSRLGTKSSVEDFCSEIIL